MTTIVSEPSIAAGLADVALAARRPRRGGDSWVAISAQAALDVLATADAPLVLGRPPSADPGAACLWVAARALGLVPVALPADPSAARWAVALAACWARADIDDLHRRLTVVCAAAAAAGVDDDGNLADRFFLTRPAVLARWATLGATR